MIQTTNDHSFNDESFFMFVGCSYLGLGILFNNISAAVLRLHVQGSESNQMKAEILINAKGKRRKQQCRRAAQSSCVLRALSHAFNVEIGA